MPYFVLLVRRAEDGESEVRVTTGRRVGLIVTGAVGVAWILGAEWVSITRDVPENHFIDALGGLTFLAGGLIAMDRRPGNVIGPLMLAVAFVSYFGNYGNLQVAPLPLLGVISGQLAPPLLAHIALAYPTGKVRSAFDRVVVGTIYCAATAANVLLIFVFAPRAWGCGRCAPEPAPFPSLDVYRDALSVYQRIGFFLALFFLAAVVRRWRQATPAMRRDLTPLWIAVSIIALVYLLGAFASPFLNDPFAYLLWELQAVLQISLPVVFVWGLLSSRLARSAVGDLVVALQQPLRPGELRAPLARALGDPSLELLYPLDGQDRWVDAEGRPASLGPVSSEWASVTIVQRDKRPLAALKHDPGLDPELVRAAAAAAGMSIENERLHAEVRAQLEEVRQSRRRIVEAGDRERRRIERNLHDGAQQRLAALALSLALVKDGARADEATATALAEAAEQLRLAIGELRELARGIHPAILTEEGLTAAVESLADRSTLTVQVKADFEERLPQPVEAVAYFVVAESLTNVAKYACASQVLVRLSLLDESLRVEVTDDGIGGADPGKGSGLRGLDDRVSAVRGRFLVETPPAGGTRVLAEIPCDG
jgi:signal transduction histidine kinase